MSDLVGNPNCWFCHAQAHFALFIVVNGASLLFNGLPLTTKGTFIFFLFLKKLRIILFTVLVNFKPHRKSTCLKRHRTWIVVMIIIIHSLVQSGRIL